MQLATEGFALVPGLLSQAECDVIAQRLDASEARGVGSRRILQLPWCTGLATRVMGHEVVRAALPSHARPVQCTFFEKSTAKNWLVPIHQDLSIPVARRVDDPAFTGWSEKNGSVYVHAPDSVIEQLLAVRVHVDACSSADGPLRVVPGSHQSGRVGPARAAQLGRANGIEVPARRGDALLMRPLLLHASSKSSGSSQRRVLHFLFGPEELPSGLAW
jgi:hypothetical protein